MIRKEVPRIVENMLLLQVRRTVQSLSAKTSLNLWHVVNSWMHERTT
ncbi:MAG: hypothetical protein AB1700_01740 [Bacillota bacterium]